MQRTYTPIGLSANNPELPNFTRSPLSAAVDPRSAPQAPTPDTSRSLFEEARQASWVIPDGEALDRAFKSYAPSDWKVTEEDFKQLGGRYDNDQLEALLESTNEEEWSDLIAEFDETNDRRDFLASHGWEGAAAEIGTTLLDPVLWGATIAAEAGGIALVGQRLSRIGRIARATASAGVAESAIAGVRVQTTNDYAAQDVMFDMLAAMTITGSLEAALGKSIAPAIKEFEDIRTQEALSGARGNDAGAAKTKPQAMPSAWRIDEYANRIRSGNQTAADATRTHMQDPVLGGSESTAVKAERLRDHHTYKANKVFHEVFQWDKKQQGVTLSPIEAARRRAAVADKVWRARVLGEDHGPEIKKAAAQLGKQYDEFLKEAKEADLHGFADLESDPAYMIQEWDHRSWSRVAKELEEQEFVELLHRGLNGFDEVPLDEQIVLKKAELNEVKASDSVIREGAESGAKNALEKQVAELEALKDARARLAMGFFRRMSSRTDGERYTVDELVETEGNMVSWLREHEDYSKLSEAEVSEMVKKALTPVTKKHGDVVDRAKRRIKIDASAKITAKNGKEYQVADLMNRDALQLHHRYVNSMSGNIAFAQNGVKRPSDWKAMLDAAHVEEMRRTGGNRKKADELINSLEQDRREIMGLPRYDLSSNWNRLGSLAMKWNYGTLMGKAALSAIAEGGRIAVEAGMRNTLRSMSSFNGLFTDAWRTFNKHPHIVSEVNAFNASIGDEYVLRLFNSYDETGLLEGTMTDGFLNKAEIIAHRGTQIMAKASLLAPVDKALRLLSFSASTNSLYQHLIKGAKTKLDLEYLDLDPDKLAAIKSAMERHTEVGPFGNVEKLGIENWDRATADDFMNAMTTNGARQVQKMLAGESNRLLSHPVGRIFLQFRSFQMGAWGKHSLADLHRMKTHPTRVLQATMFSMIFAGLAYYSRSMVSTLGMDEGKRKEYLQDRLAPERVIANAANYAPSTGAAVTLWNNVPGLMLPEAQIPVYRASSLGNSITPNRATNPTEDKIRTIISLLHNVPETEGDTAFRKVRRLVPGQNTIVGDAILNPIQSAVE